MEAKLFLQIFFLQLLGQIFLVFGQQCTQSGACSCTMTNTGKVVDLEPLASKDGQPRFIHQDTGGTFFYYNPCTPFKKGDVQGECQGNDVAACQYDGAGYYDIGDQKTLATSYDTSTGAVLFTYSTSTTRSTELLLECTQDPAVQFTATEKTGSPGKYVMTISSLCVCPGRSKDCNSAGSASGLSPGSTMCILLTVFVLVYVAGGMLFLRFARGAEGTEMIPNYEFWADFPYLVKDGFTFATRSCRGEEAYAYEKI
ncbi:uncharacterized protein LOC144928659 isoform X1 [Branchiostoma floridae x Branchiostoma belcheri]